MLLSYHMSCKIVCLIGYTGAGGSDGLSGSEGTKGLQGIWDLHLLYSSIYKRNSQLYRVSG